MSQEAAAAQSMTEDPIRLVIVRQNRRTGKVYSLDMIEEAAGRNNVPMERVHEKMREIYGEKAELHEIYTVEPFLNSHDTRVKNLQRDRDPGTGAWFSNANKFYHALCQVGVVHWTLPYGADMEGWEKMPVWMSSRVGPLIEARCYEEMEDAEDFLDVLSGKLNPSSTEGTSPSPTSTPEPPSGSAGGKASRSTT